MKTKPRTKLTLTKLRFVSAVDMPAQETALAAIIKATGAITATCRVAKVDAELGIVMGFAFTTSVDDQPYFDLQGDAIDETNLVKIAAEYMAAGGDTDEMHDEQRDGQVVFCWPLTKEIAKALDIQTSKTGLLVGIKPSADVLAKFKSGEYTGFSIGGMGTREAVKSATACKGCSASVDKSASYCPSCGATMKSAQPGLFVVEVRMAEASSDAQARTKKARAIVLDSLRRTELRKQRLAASVVAKDVVLTDEVDGHQHAIDLDDPAGWCGDRLSTTYATSEGADTGHQHVWTFDPVSGVVTIAADSGHTHSVTDSVPADVLAVFALNEKAEDAENATAVLERVLDGDAGAASVSVSVAARAPNSNSTLQNAPVIVASKAKESAVDPKDKQIADLTKRNERLERISKLSPAHFGHLLTLAIDDVDAFLVKSTADRDAIVQTEVAKRAAGDEVVFTSPVDGAVYRKSHDPQLVAMAKREAEARASIEKNEIRAIAKAHMAGMVGGDDVHDYIVASIRKGGGDAELQKKALQTLKGAAVAVLEVGKPAGGNPDRDTPVVKSAHDMLREHVEKYQTDNKIPSYQQAFAKAIREDAKTAELYVATKN